MMLLKLPHCQRFSSLECCSSLPYFSVERMYWAMDLSDEEKRELLTRARSAINTQRGNAPAAFPRPSSGQLSEPHGVFVTLRVGTELRGCIGYVESKMPLGDTVEEVVRKAAFEDPRFPPVAPEEIPGLTIEISLLSPLEVVKNVDTIEVGKHGLVIEAGGRRGLLLPHVATEYGWDREEFLNHTALKAGLTPDFWRSGDVLISSFTTDTFSETE